MKKIIITIVIGLFSLVGIAQDTVVVNAQMKIVQQVVNVVYDVQRQTCTVFIRKTTLINNKPVFDLEESKDIKVDLTSDDKNMFNTIIEKAKAKLED